MRPWKRCGLNFLRNFLTRKWNQRGLNWSPLRKMGLSWLITCSNCIKLALKIDSAVFFLSANVLAYWWSVSAFDSLLYYGIFIYCKIISLFVLSVSVFISPVLCSRVPVFDSRFYRWIFLYLKIIPLFVLCVSVFVSSVLWSTVTAFNPRLYHGTFL